ncbi:unnamed protein product [Brassica oleracea]
MAEESVTNGFQSMWDIKQKDLEVKERLSKMSILEALIAKKEPLADYEEALKKKLIIIACTCFQVKAVLVCLVSLFSLKDQAKNKNKKWNRLLITHLMDQWMMLLINNLINILIKRPMPMVIKKKRKKRRKQRAYIERNREEGDLRLWNDYFSDTPTYPPNLFRRRFRMNKHLFMHIVQRLSNEVQFFQPKKDALGRVSLSPLQKCTSAIRILAYGNAADAVDEYLRLGATTARSCLEHFVDGIISLFGEEYLRRPTPADLQRLLDIGEYRGFRGMIGSIDYMYWEWKNCPTAWKGQYTRGSGKPTIVLEPVASYDLWIWHAFFGPPGTLNDINVLDRSPVFDDTINGQAPQVTYSVNGREYHLAYYLTDDVERAFGVLQARFAIVKNPTLFWDKVKIGKIMRAYIIFHNMIVEDERDGYTQFDVLEFQEAEDNGSSHVDLTYSTDMPSNIANMMSARTRIRDRQMHQQLKADLVEHIWRKFRRDEDDN